MKIKREREKRRYASTYKFDGYLLVVEQIRAFENDTEGTLAYLLAHPVVNTHDVG